MSPRHDPLTQTGPKRTPAWRVWAVTAITVVASIGAIPLVAAAEDGANGGTEGDSSSDAAGTDGGDAATDTTTTTTTVPVDTTTTTTSTSTTSTTTTTVPVDTTTTTTTTVPVVPSETTTTTTTPAVTTTTTTVPAATVPTATTTTTTLPVEPEPTARGVTVFPEQMQHILATIRYLESRGIYTLPPNKGNASGAYQFIGTTWGNYAGYAHAYLAPPHIQDERAAADVNKFLAQWNNDVSMIPVMWYFPIAAREEWRMDVVPSPQHGNVLTIREYQTRWLGVFAFISGQPVEPLLTGEQAQTEAGMAPLVPEPVGDEPSIAYPVLGPSRAAIPQCDDAEEIQVADVDGSNGQELSGPSRADIEAAGLCTEHAPAVVFGVKLQPITAVADGIVTGIVDEPGTNTPITVTITSEAGISYIYAGFNDDNPGTSDGNAPDHLRLTALAQIGKQVRAGQIIGFMGDTEPLPVGIRSDVPTDATVVIDADAVAPHIRLTMIDINGNPIDAFGPVVDALFRQSCSVSIGQWSVPANGSGHEAVTIETTDNNDEIDSEWVITSTGQVTASGWAAMVNPNAGCGFTPAAAHGPGAEGTNVGHAHWFTPIDLPTEVWVRLALQDELTAPGGLLQPG